MLDDIEINRSKTLGDSSLPVSLTMKGVAPGSSAVVVIDDGTVQLPDTKTSSSAIAQVFFTQHAIKLLIRTNTSFCKQLAMSMFKAGYT